MNAPDRLDSVRDRDAGQPGARRRVALERDSKVANAATFTLLREDHTVGHLLRMELLSRMLHALASYCNFDAASSVFNELYSAGKDELASK